MAYGPLSNSPVYTDLSELSNAGSYVLNLPPTGSVPANWLPKSSTDRFGRTVPQGALYNPKVGYTAPKTTNTTKKPGALTMPMLSSHGVNVKPTTTPKTPNSITPISSPVGFATVGGKRINYEDIGNPLKDVALKAATNYSFGTSPSETSSTSTTGATNLTDLLKTIQSIQPVQNYTNRIAALNTGNTTWDMNSLDKILAAKAEQQADTERYQQEVGALANLGSAQMNAEAARAGHQTILQGEREKIAAMAPYYGSEVQKNIAQAQAAPLAAKADVLKALTEQSKNDPVLKASLDTLVKLGELGDRKAYNALAAKLAMITGKLIPPLPEED